MFAVYSKAKDLSSNKNITTRLGRITNGNRTSRAVPFTAKTNRDGLFPNRSPDLDRKSRDQDLGQAKCKNNTRGNAAARLKDTLMAGSRGHPQGKAHSKQKNDWPSY
jgi:hypothetical protein